LDPSSLNSYRGCYRYVQPLTQRDRRTLIKQWKTFQWGDIMVNSESCNTPCQANIQANLLGSTLFLYLAHLLSNRQRRRNELSSVYQPLADSTTYRDSRGREHAFNHDAQPPRETRPRAGSNAWDEGSEAGDERRGAFQLGDDEDEGDRRRTADTLV
jgi:hypothetical protein